MITILGIGIGTDRCHSCAKLSLTNRQDSISVVGVMKHWTCIYLYLRCAITIDR